MTRIKICGLTRMRDAELALELGANALGFVMEPSSPRCVFHHEGAAEIAQALGPYATCVAVFGEHRPEVGLKGYSAIQSVDLPTVPAAMRRIRTYRVHPEATIDEALQAAEGADALLLDAYHPQMAGGTGNKVSLSFAQELARRVPVPLVLAGGLNPDNVWEAVQSVQPYAVDVSSGVESEPGVKDAAKLKAFIRATRGV